jgi:hypothetical protein
MQIPMRISWNTVPHKRYPSQELQQLRVRFTFPFLLHPIPLIKSPDAVSRVKDVILNDPDTLNNKTKWIRGSGWDHTVWSSLPSAVRFFALLAASVLTSYMT